MQELSLKKIVYMSTGELYFVSDVNTMISPGKTMYTGFNLFNGKYEEINTNFEYSVFSNDKNLYENTKTLGFELPLLFGTFDNFFVVGSYDVENEKLYAYHLKMHTFADGKRTTFEIQDRLKEFTLAEFFLNVDKNNVNPNALLKLKKYTEKLSSKVSQDELFIEKRFSCIATIPRMENGIVKLLNGTTKEIFIQHASIQKIK